MINFEDYNFKGKKAIVRVDFNVPLNKSTYEVRDDTRIRAAIPTIKKIISDGGAVLLMSHLGRPENGPEDRFSLKHVLSNLSDLLDQKVDFAADCIGADAKRKAKGIGSGEILVLENLRFHKDETAGSGLLDGLDPRFALLERPRAGSDRSSREYTRNVKSSHLKSSSSNYIHPKNRVLGQTQNPQNSSF